MIVLRQITMLRSTIGGSTVLSVEDPTLNDRLAHSADVTVVIMEM